MSSATLKFWNDGRPFAPEVYPQDVADYTPKEAEILRPAQEAREALREAEALVQDLKDGGAKHVEVARAEAARGKAHAAFLAADEAAKGPLLKLQADFVAEVLRRCTPPLDKPLKLTVAQIRGGFHEIWTAAHDWRDDAEAPAPLASTGGTSAPSPSRA